MLLNTGANKTIISQRLADHYQVNRIASKVRFFWLADSSTLAITHEATTFLVRLSELHTSFFGPIKPGLNHNVIAGINWMRHSHPYINWDTMVITLARNRVGFQIYSVKMHKLLKDTVFIWLTEAEGYDYQGGQVDFSQCSAEIIHGIKPKHETIPKPSLWELLQ